jgi:glucosylceramidase
LGLIVVVFGLACSRRPTTPPVVRQLQSAPASPTSPASSGEATLIVTTSGTPFARKVLDSTTESASATISIDVSQLRQSITNFGGAFNEQGWAALSVLSPADREAALRALFDRETGLSFDYCRLPIGASDYALDRYTLDESPADYQLAHFSIERDKQRLIPYVKAAQSVRPDLTFWASAWTPPTWMKTPAVFDGGAFRDEPKVYAAYALYLARFVESYAALGIPISMLVPQNEPQELTHYPSCDWQPSQYVTFLRDHAGPLFKQRGLQTQLFLGTINRDQWDLLSVLRDEGAAPYIAGVALQWNGIAHAAGVRAARPALPIMQSETECGNNHWQAGFNPEHASNDFGYAAHTWRKLRDFFKVGASSYMLWNMVLDEQGKNIDSLRPWPQNSAIVVDRPSKRVIYTPMYWATKHFSRLVARGARLVASDSTYQDQIAFLNPDGTLVVELMNEGDAAVSLNVANGAHARTVNLPAHSFGSLLLPHD